MATVRLSKQTSFTVRDLPDNTQKNITFSHIAPEGKYNNLMVVTFPLIPPNFIPMLDTPIGKIIETIPTYVLSPEGLYYIDNSSREVTKADLVTDDKNKLANLSEKLGNGGKVLTPNEQATIKSITNHAPYIERAMHYSEGRWSISLDRPANLQENFLIIPNVKPTDAPEVKQNALPLQKGFIALEKGKIQPYIYNNPNASKGKFKQFLYGPDGSIKKPVKESELKEDERLITVYFPPRYDAKRNIPYNMQVVLDGDPVNMQLMRMKTTLDNLIAKNKIEPVVAVFVPPFSGTSKFENRAQFEDAMNRRLKEYGCSAETADKLALLPAALRGINLNVTSKREQTSIIGMSMGGLQAGYTAILHQEIFGNVIAQSPSVFWSPLNRIIMLSDNSPLPENIPDDSILVKRTEDQIHIYKQLDNAMTLEKTLQVPNDLSLAKFTELPFPDNGQREILRDQNGDLFDTITIISGTSWHIPANEKKEHLRQAIETGLDQISGRVIQSLPMNFYLQVGDQESELKAATDRLATILQGRKDTIVYHTTFSGGHDYHQWRGEIASAVIALHPRDPNLDLIAKDDRLMANSKFGQGSKKAHANTTTTLMKLRVASTHPSSHISNIFPADKKAEKAPLSDTERRGDLNPTDPQPSNFNPSPFSTKLTPDGKK
jgi:enterochelin esterase-like enzyme